MRRASLHLAFVILAVVAVVAYSLGKKEWKLLAAMLISVIAGLLSAASFIPAYEQFILYTNQTLLDFLLPIFEERLATVFVAIFVYNFVTNRRRVLWQNGTAGKRQQKI